MRHARGGFSPSFRLRPADTLALATRTPRPRTATYSGYASVGSGPYAQKSHTHPSSRSRLGEKPTLAVLALGRNPTRVISSPSCGQVDGPSGDRCKSAL
jgi:hypothetical protein